MEEINRIDTLWGICFSIEDPGAENFGAHTPGGIEGEGGGTGGRRILYIQREKRKCYHKHVIAE